MNIKILNKKLSGYERAFRGRFLLLRDKVLSDNEYILWDLSFSVLADWDKNHEETYGSFDISLEKIGYYLSWSKSKVSRIGRKLYDKKFWEVDSDGRTLVNGFKIKEHLSDLAKSQKLIDLQQFISNQKNNISDTTLDYSEMKYGNSKGVDNLELQSVAEQQHSNFSTLGSSKVNSGFTRSMGEYEKIKDDMKGSMEIDEMIWIDNHI